MTTLTELNNQINHYTNLKQLIVSEKKEYETQIAKINAKYGSNLPHKKFIKVKEQRRRIVKNINRLENEITKYNELLKPLYQKRDQEFSERIDKKQIDQIISTDSIIQQIQELRNKYLEFSQDYTRVNSMRLMAAQFVEELEKITSS